ncbi:uncharacterized protein BO66DRAFT_390366 [Aspergillus aculeatinus CBS 121060]|uniref:Uncharacterized protein n=1 Tax=Aspergillus aculeatinus CBS 121060 TaxID=1448322 RepID=A0ACD1HEJ0_9EURO|nr:hypothetical protein BO66DRAFT_390366 [Aspergillus aculeatinus CBS 121060]RAH72247.1 hypothetical protein BO66DRAFT_390366 [Aspergillus aculeatinus CBS 121060]
MNHLHSSTRPYQQPQSILLQHHSGKVTNASPGRVVVYYGGSGLWFIGSLASTGLLQQLHAVESWLRC